MAGKLSTKIKLDDLQYYFDSKEKDALDSGSHSRKNREVMTLRDKLLALSDREFDVAIKALKNIIQTDTNPSPRDENKTSDAQSLYQSVRN